MSEKSFDILEKLTTDSKGEVYYNPLLENEIKTIRTEEVRLWVNECLNAAELVWVAPVDNDPTSLSYPPDEFVEGGLVLHIKRLVRSLNIIFQAVLLTDEEMDLVYAAALLAFITKPVFITDDPADCRFDQYHIITAGFYAQEILNGSETQRWAQSIEPEVLARVIRLIHCINGCIPNVMEFVPQDVAESAIASANLLAQSVHYIVDGEEPNLDRWLDV